MAIPEEEKKKTTARRPSERQDPCNSVNVSYVNEWLAIEKDAEITIVIKAGFEGRRSEREGDAVVVSRRGVGNI